MHSIDWAIIGVYVFIVTLVGFVFIRRASGSVAEYFVAGRNLPWWLAGTSLVATSFAADTPLVIAGIVATKGIAGNWLWWNQIITWSLAIVFFARLWRRSGILTDAEFIELRYGGRSGAFLRGFKAVYNSAITSTYTIAWVMLAMQKIINVTIAQPAWVAEWQLEITQTMGWAPDSIDLWKWLLLVILFLAATLYTVLSGFWGIVVTDLIQFIVAMIGSIAFAVFAVDSVGGMSSLLQRLGEQIGAEGVEGVLGFFPGGSSPWTITWGSFAICLAVLWWSDCGGFAAQRLFSTRTEHDSTLAAVWYSVAHFVLRPWPWIVVALVAMVYYPNLEDPESGYPKLMMEILPVGLRGLLVASLLAAFMSTVDTHLNLNASYFVNDLYRRFWKPEATEKQCVAVSRWATVGYAALGIVIAYSLTSIVDAWVYLLSLQAAVGLVTLLRWFWWRINAWSEVSAMLASFVGTVVLTRYYHLEGPELILYTVLVSLPVWVAATLLTNPVERSVLESFYRKVRPGGVLWRPVARNMPDVQSGLGGMRMVAVWLLAGLALYSAMIGLGKLILTAYLESAVCFAFCIFCYLLITFCRDRSKGLLEE